MVIQLIPVKTTLSYLCASILLVSVTCLPVLSVEVKKNQENLIDCSYGPRKLQKLDSNLVNPILIAIDQHETASQQGKYDLQAGQRSVLSEPNVVSARKSPDFPINDTRNILFVLDVSKSMNQEFKQSKTNLDLAKELIDKTLDTLPKFAQCGLRYYGTEPKPTLEGRNTELIVPVGANKKQIRSAVRKLEPARVDYFLPFAYMFNEILEHDLKYLSGNTLVIILSNGRVNQKVNPKSFTHKIPPTKVFFLNLSSQQQNRRGIARLKRQNPLLAELHTCFEPISYLKELTSSTNGLYFDAFSLNSFLTEIKRIK